MGFLRLARPANLPTAAADILAGLAIAGLVGSPELLANSPWAEATLLLLASIALYAGGVTLNDVFDAAIDSVERPERPIPSGVISRRAAALFGVVLLLLGVILAFASHPFSGYIALLLALAIVLYDAYTKKFTVFGPLNMGICRGLNLLLGMSVLGFLPNWEFGLIPVLYIFAITLISRGEVHGDNKNHLIWAGLLYSLVIFGVVYIVTEHPSNIYEVLLALVLFGLLIFTPLVKAYRNNSPGNIRKAVKAGVLSLIVLDAALAVVFAPWWYGLLILLLWPLSGMLSKIFAVT